MPTSKVDALPFSRGVIAILIVVSAMAPLATAMYLPAIPIAQADLLATPVAMQLTLTAFIVGTALGQLLVGPISDVTGRRGSLLVALALYVGASLAVALSPNVTWLIGWRVVQGMGAGGGMVLARAIVADRATGVVAAKLLGIMMAIGVVAPAVAPLLGVVLLNVSDWRGIFTAVVIAGVLLTVAVFLRLPETRERSSDRGAGPALDMTDRSWGRFIPLVAAGGLSFAAMYSLVSAGPYLYQGQFGFSPEGYASVSALTSVGMGVVTFVGTRKLGKDSRFGVLTPRLMATVALVALVVGGLFVGAAHLLDAPIWLWIIALTFATMPVGLASGTITALIMDAAPIPPGAASAVAGVVMAGLGAVMPPIVGLGGDRPSGVMALALLVAALLALVTFLVGVGRRGVRTREPELASA